MASHSFHRGDNTGISLPHVVPVELSSLTQLSWELGSRVVDDDETTRHSEWKQTGRRWLLSVFRATRNTVVLCVRTPAGREKFYGAALDDLESNLSALDSAPDWHRHE